MDGLPVGASSFPAVTLLPPGPDDHLTLIAGTQVVTMNATRDIIRNGAVVVQGDRIVAVGKAADLTQPYPQATVVGADHFDVTPGLLHTPMHITGEPLT